MVMDDNVEIVGFFNDLSLLLRDAENRNPGIDLLILKEKFQQSIRTLHFILTIYSLLFVSRVELHAVTKKKHWVAMTTFAIEKRK